MKYDGRLEPGFMWNAHAQFPAMKMLQNISYPRAGPECSMRSTQLCCTVMFPNALIRRKLCGTNKHELWDRNGSLVSLRQLRGQLCASQKECGMSKETRFGETSSSFSLWSCDLGIDQFT